MKNMYKTLFSNTLIFAIGTIGSKLITFLLVPLYTNILTRSEYGTADFIITCSLLIVPVISLVIQDSVLRFGLSKEYESGAIVKNAMLIFVFGSLIMVSLVPILKIFNSISKWRWYIVVLVIANNLNNIMYTYAKSKEMNKLYSVGSFLQALTLVIINVVLLVFLKKGISGYLIANIFAYLIPSLIIILFSGFYKDVKKAKFDARLMKNMIKYSVPLIANNLSWWLLNSFNRIIIEYFMTTDDLGLYTAASKIPSLLSIVTTIFSSAWSISSIKEYDNDNDYKNFYSEVFKLYCIVMSIGGSFIILINKPFMGIYVGESFFESWTLVPILIVGTVFYSYSSFFGSFYGVAKKNFMVTITTIIAATINVVFSIILVPVIGLLGAVISNCCGYVVIGLLRMINSRKYIYFDIDFKMFILNSILLIVQAIFVSLNYKILLISFVCFSVLIVCNYKSIGEVFKKMLYLLKNK